MLRPLRSFLSDERPRWLFLYYCFWIPNDFPNRLQWNFFMTSFLLFCLSGTHFLSALRNLRPDCFFLYYDFWTLEDILDIFLGFLCMTSTADFFTPKKRKCLKCWMAQLICLILVFFNFLWLPRCIAVIFFLTSFVDFHLRGPTFLSVLSMLSPTHVVLF